MDTEYGHCHCGCGNVTKISDRTVKKYGCVRGQPRRFIKGHSGAISANLTFTFEERFWAKVDKTGDCWQWKGHINHNGYGTFTRDGKTLRTNRIVWELSNGTIPTGLCVLHECDNPGCVNPTHLFLGTYADNNSDCKNKGRARGNTKPRKHIGADCERQRKPGRRPRMQITSI